MGFKLDLSTQITYAVKFPVVNTNGVTNEHTIKFDYLRVSREKLDEYLPSEIDTETKITSAEGLDRDVDWLMKFTHGWHDVDIAGSTEFNRENFRTLLSSIPNLANLIYQKFIEANTGGASKN